MRSPAVISEPKVAVVVPAPPKYPAAELVACTNATAAWALGARKKRRAIGARKRKIRE
jgi:hypothetical protein